MEQEQSPSLFSLEVDHISSENLSSVGKWGNFSAIVGMIGMGLLALFIVFVGDKILNLFTGSISLLETNLGSTRAILIIIVVVFFLVIGAMLYLLFSGSTAIQKAVRTKDQQLFNKGLANLKSYFIIYTILSAAGLVTNLFGII